MVLRRQRELSHRPGTDLAQALLCRLRTLIK